MSDTDNHKIKAFGFANDTNLSHINTQGGTLVYNSSNNARSNNNLTSVQVTFVESGLPTGIGFCWPFWNCVSNWSVMINAHTYNGTANTISFFLIPGTYLYSIIPPKGYSVTPSSGGLLVQSSTHQDITFQKNILQ